MGFDIECIVDIHTYPGEFFCPVCRTLVYPNEALQSQCTHLYCKPCLAHIANGSRACPYDGYLVTESDSKPLIESDKALAENIGKVKVHCLYYRSGCTWEGRLSECTSHCTGCTFGNSPVICNRCGVQIVHRQVHDHAQSCTGVYQTQQMTESVQVATSLGPASATTATDSNQTVVQSGSTTSQAQNLSTAAPSLHGQDISQQTNPNFQAPTVAATAVPTPEQWYQQQYQQYYQQYAGYDPHQQSYNQYYPYQQPFQQYQQNSLHMQGQHQSQVYAQPQQQVQPQNQPQPQVQPPNQPQSQVQPPNQPQPQVQPPNQPQPQVQPPNQPQPQVQPPNQPQLQSQPLLQTQQHHPPQTPQPQPQPQTQTQSLSLVPPQGQPQIHAPVRALAPVHQVNPLQQLHPPMQSQAQVPVQNLPPPHGQPAPQPPHYAQGQAHPQPPPMRPSAQQQQAPQYVQPHSQMYYAQASQVQHQPQPQLQSQPQSQSQPQLQSHLHAQPQALLQHPPQSHPQLRPPQLNQPTAPIAQPQALHPSAPSIMGHHSYPQPHSAQQMQSGSLQQHSMHPLPTSGSIPPVQIHGQASQQPALMRPPHSHGQLPQQQASTLLPPQGQVPGNPPGQQQQFQAHSQQPAHQVQHLPVMQPVRPNIPQQPFPGPAQSHLPPQGHFPQQPLPPPQPQVWPHVPLHMTQQNVAVPPSSLAQQSHNYVGRPMIANHGHPPSLPQSSAGFGIAQLRPTQLNLNQPSTNLSDAKSVVLERHDDHVSENYETNRELGSTQNVVGKDSKALGADANDMKSLKSEAVTNNDQQAIGEVAVESGENKTVLKDAEFKVDAAKDALVDSSIKQTVEEDGSGSSLKSSSGGRPVGNASVEDKYAIDNVHKEEINSLSGRDSLQQIEPLEHRKPEFQKGTNAGASSVDPIKVSHTTMLSSASSSNGYELPPWRPNPPQQQRPPGPSMMQLGSPPGHPPRSQVPAYPQPMLRPHGPGLLPQPGQSFNQIENQPLSGIPDPGSKAHFGRGPGQLGARPGSFELHSAPHGSLLTAVAPGSVDPRAGIMGRAPPLGPDQFGSQHPFRSNEAETFQNQRPVISQWSGSLERGPQVRLPGNESIPSRMNPGAGPDSSKLGLLDEKFKAFGGEHLNNFQMELTQPLDQAARPLDNAPLDPSAGVPPSRFLPPHHPAAGFLGEKEMPVGYDGSNRGRVDPVRGNQDLFGPGPEFGRQMKQFTSRSPDREYLGISSRGFGSNVTFPHGHSGINDIDGVEAGRFGEASRSFNLPSDPGRNSFRDGRFPPFSGQMWRGDMDGPGNSRFGDHMASGPPLNHTRSDDIFGPDSMSGQFRRGELLGPHNLSSHMHMGEPAAFGPFPIHARIGEFTGPDNFPHHPSFGESIRGDKSGLPRPGEPGFRSNYSRPGFSNSEIFAGDLDSLDKSRKRKSISMGWCRICRVDCETVEGLDMHSQTREHQKMAMDMVISIKQQNRKKQKTFGGRASLEESGKTRNAGYEGRGKKP